MYNSLEEFDIIYDTPPGMFIDRALELLVEHVQHTGRSARVRFNDTVVDASPGDGVPVLYKRWRDARES